MTLRRTQAVTLKSGETVNVLPREIPGLKAAGLLSKDAKARRAAKVTPKNDAKEAAEKAAKEKEEKDAGKTKEQKDTGTTKAGEVSGAITTDSVKK